MTAWKNYLEANQDRYLKELLEFLSIPSISSLKEYKADVAKAGEWVAARLQAAGIENVQVLPTGGHPVVYGDWMHAPDKPTVLIYGHFDTQPVDPLELWTQPPFEPALKDNRVYARGASDDKGNMLAPILAVEALLSSESRLPVNVKCFFEGQEEIGSPQLPEFISANRQRLACDLILSADGGQWDEDQPALMIGLRGLCNLQIDVRAARSDTHSGTFGGTIMNPIHALVRLIDTMHTPQGAIAVEGFYDAVRPLTEPEQDQIAEIPFDEADYKAELGVDALFGEPGYSTYERAWIRPTLEVNGIWGGFQGEGVKTVLPGSAHAKISCRLVPDQDPAQILKLLTTHIEKHTPPGVKVALDLNPSTADPYLIPFDHPGNQAAADVHKELFGKEPYYARMGGSIPVCGIFLKELGAYTVNFAFGLKDENVHGPDEFFRLKSFSRAQLAYGMLLEQLSKYERA
ncbi:MAG: dipeptidase [Desulfobacterales bacterium]|jgi:acetylornithine deacetylase/succinyl-diaminopimelate desuccinylase-like protein|nr:dipeptidase [Desulfobacterales bacterium]